MQNLLIGNHNPKQTIVRLAALAFIIKIVKSCNSFVPRCSADDGNDDSGENDSRARRPKDFGPSSRRVLAGRPGDGRGGI